jgi:hypothetical protein
MAPIEFIGRYMPGWFDYAICDEIHQLAGDTAQGNALGTLSSCTDRIVGLTGTLLGGYADDLFNTLFRLEAARMKEHSYEWGTTGPNWIQVEHLSLMDVEHDRPILPVCAPNSIRDSVQGCPTTTVHCWNRVWHTLPLAAVQTPLICEFVSGISLMFSN